MNQSQHRLQQLQQAIHMKFAVLTKQKEDIKEIIDDYLSQVVARSNKMLNQEQEVMSSSEMYHEILQSLDKASQVLTDVTIQLISILDAGDSMTVESAQIFRKTENVENAGNISTMSENGRQKTVSTLFQINTTNEDIQIEKKTEQQQECRNHIQEQTQKQREQEEDPDVKPVNQGLKLREKFEDKKPAQVSHDLSKTEMINTFSISLSPVTMSTISAPLPSSSESFVTSVPSENVKTPHGHHHSAAYRVFSQHLDISRNTWPHGSSSEPHVFMRPMTCPLSSPHQPSFCQCTSCYAEHIQFHNLPQTSLPISQMTNQYNGAIPVELDSNSLADFTVQVPFGTSSVSSHSLGHSYDCNNFYNPIFTEQPILQHPDSPYSWAALLGNFNSSCSARDTTYQLLQVDHLNNHSPIMNTVSQNEESNHTLTSCYTAAGSAIPDVVELIPKITEISYSQSQVTVSPGSSVLSSTTADYPGLMTDTSSIPGPVTHNSESTENCILPQSHLSHSQCTQGLGLLIAPEKYSSTSELEITFHKSSPIERDHKSASNNCSGQRKSEAHLPKSIKRLLPLKKDTKKLQTHTRSLQELIREVQADSDKKPTACGRDGQVNVNKEGIPISPANKLQENWQFHTENMKTNGNLKVQEIYIKPVQLQKDSIFPGVISSVTHPWHFHVQLIDCMQDICRLIRHSVETRATQAVSAQKGLFCLARFSEFTYYRAKILSVQEKDSLVSGVKVEYIDYGLKKLVSPADIYAIPDCLTKYPCQALFCALSQVSPKNADHIWTEEAILQFQQYTKDVQVLVKVVHPSPSKTKTLSLFPHVVDILFETSQVSQSSHKNKTHISMAEHLIEGGFAQVIKEDHHIAALGKIYLSLEHNTYSKFSSFNNLVSDVSAQPHHKTQTEPAQIKLDALDHPLHFPKTNYENSEVDTFSKILTEQQSISPSPCINSSTVPDITTSCTEKSSQVKINNKLSMLVDKELHLLGQVLKTSQQKNTSNVTVPELSISVSDSQVSISAQNHENSQLSLSEEGTKEFLVMVSAVISPSSFFVHCVEKKFVQEFLRLENRLRLVFEKYSTSELVNLSSSFRPTKYSLVCASHSENACFYRGLVLNLGISGSEERNRSSAAPEMDIKKLLIFFIDYGDSEWVPRSKVFPLPREFKNLTPLVLWFTLSDVGPCCASTTPGDKSANLLWSADSVNKFKSMVSEDRIFSAVMTETSLAQINVTSFQTKPVPVFLLDRSISGEEICINYELIHLGFASLEVAANQDDHNKGIDWDPMKEEYMSIRNSYKVNTDEAGVALVGYTAGDVGNDGQKVCVYFNRPRGCRRGNQCPNLHIKMNLSDVAYGRVPVKVFDDDQLSLQPGSVVTVTVSSVETPSLFYVTLPGDNLGLRQAQDKRQTLQENLEEENLENMMDNLNKFYSTSAQYDGDLMLITPGQAMAAKVHGRWIRAKVVDIDTEHGLVQVMSVDFGNLDWVNERDVHDLALQFMHLAPQAVKCSLDLEPATDNSNWMKETCDQFAKMVTGRTLSASIKTKYPSGHYSIVLYDSSEIDNISLNQKLVDAGLALWPVRKTLSGKTQKTDNSVMMSCVSG